VNQYLSPDYVPIARNVPRAQRVFLETNGDGPWLCSYCDELIYELGRDSGKGNVHHKDEDPLNDTPNNLEVLHAECHVRHHQKGRPHSAEHNAKIGRKGRVFTDEWKAKLSARQRTRVRCPECDFTSSPQHVGIHRKKCHV
jgi:hypothetical protein